MSPPLTSLLGISRSKLGTLLEPHIDRPFRVDQIYRAIYESRVESFEEMTGLPKALRSELAKLFSISRPPVATRQKSGDSTVKYLFELEDGATFEAVDIPDGDRRTVCVSSQAGCALACRFCVTGYWGAGRDLSAGEILGQVMTVEEDGGLENRRNLVFMGMGEPLLNLPNLSEALHFLFERYSWRRITVSTAGVLPGLEEMASWERRPQLAISLHAPDEDRRSELMPINKRYPLQDLLALLERYPLVAKQRITFEYVMIDGFNDSLADADALALLLRRQRAKINLIPLNEDPVLGPEMKTSPAAKVEAFRRRLVERGLPASTRVQRGDDVAAACGQLRAFGREARGFRRSNISL